MYFFMEEECWASLGELERQENLLGELDSKPEAGVTYAEEKNNISDETIRVPCSGKFLQGDFTVQGQRQGRENDSEHYPHLHHGDDGGSGDEDGSLPTIYFSCNTEPKKVHKNTGKKPTHSIIF